MRFKYLVQDMKGATSRGVLQAPTQDEAVATLRSKGYAILQLQVETARRFGWLGTGKVSRADQVFFGEQFATLLDGGIPLMSALSVLSAQGTNVRMGEVLGKVASDVARGLSFHDALAKQEDVFDPLWVALVRSGELAGNLPQSVLQMTQYLQDEEEIRTKVVTAMVYPFVLFLMTIGILLFFVLQIVPTLREVFSAFNLTLPPLTLGVIAFSNFVKGYPLPIALSLLGGIIAARLFLGTQAGQNAKVRVLYGLPIFGSFFEHVVLERLLTTFGVLLANGVDILTTMDSLERLFQGNVVVQKSLAAIKTDVTAGRAIWESFQRRGHFPVLVTDMIKVGEQSGKLQRVLKVLGNFYRMRINQFIRRFTALIDPIMIIMVGGIVGVIVISMFLPIFQLSRIR